ncbi:Cytochrome c oxidase assembly protein cox15 [Sparganum proliferum]
MTLSDFKFIWHMEYGHRQWGRLLGLVYALPAGYFWYKGYFSKRMKPRVVAYGVLIAFQGLLGWYMVKSGLKKPQPPVGIDPNEDFVGVPRVSHFRLAAHLSAATILYSLFLWASFSHFVRHPKIPTFKGLLRLKIWTHSSKALVFTTLVWGAFVAGLDAGLVYNSWPKMADRWVPEDLIVPRYGSTGRNLVDNPTAVQFMHRMLAYTSVGCVCTLWGLTMIAGRGRTGPRIRNAAHLMLAAVFGQSALGVLTLLNYVPVSLGAMHQGGSLILFSTLLWFSHCLRAVPKV